MESTKVNKNKNVATKTRKQRSIRSHCIKYSYWNPRPKNKCIGICEKPVYLICSDFYSNLCSKLEADKNKYNIFWELIKAYKLNESTEYGNKLQIIDSSPATRDDLLLYHDENYISFLETIENYPSYSYQTEEEKELIKEYGLIDDCPIFDDLYEYCLNIVGSSLKCAQLIKQNKTRIAINFGGGRHHAFSSKANGYCYVNDIILCIDSLLSSPNKFNKILYIDIDLHHCDSIQEAYYNSNNVFVASIHFKDVDFFPQTGNKNEFGDKNGQFYNLNIPISSKFKLNDNIFEDIISKLCHRLNYYFQPDVILICSGCDGLKSDPLKKWNLSINGISNAINIIIEQMDKPTIILGGGGYNPIDTAKCWTKIISNSSQIQISNSIPYHNNFTQFAPHYALNKIIYIQNNNNNNNNNNNTNQNNIKNNKNMKSIHTHAIQMIYGHLNNFERLFVQKNLKIGKITNGINYNKAKVIKNNNKNNNNNNNINTNNKKEESKEEEQDNDIDLNNNNNNNSVGDKRKNTANDTCFSHGKRRKL